LATFYLLPPRPVVGDHLLDGVERIMPGLDLSVAARRRLTEALLDALELRADVFLVFREDLPARVPAERGDEVIVVRAGAPARRWQVGQADLLAIAGGK
jgi:hypothetical protein